MERLRIGVFAPSSPISDHLSRRRFETAKFRLVCDGFDLAFADNLFKRHGQSAGNVKQRLAAFDSMVKDESLRLMIAATGGIGACELLDSLDYKALKSSGKAIMGLSDITGLLNAINAKTGLVTYHGPNFCYGIVHHKNPEKIDWRSYAEFRRFIKDGCKELKPSRKYRVLRKGSGTGKLAGGNLDVFSRLIGTPYMPAGKLVLFFEDVDMKLSDIRRVLYQLKDSGIFARTRGLILGNFCDIRSYGGAASRRDVEDTFLDAVKDYSFPVLAGGMFGHNVPNTVIPIGAQARITNKVRIVSKVPIVFQGK